MWASPPTRRARRDGRWRSTSSRPTPPPRADADRGVSRDDPELLALAAALAGPAPLLLAGRPLGAAGGRVAIALLLRLGHQILPARTPRVASGEKLRQRAFGQSMPIAVGARPPVAAGRIA